MYTECPECHTYFKITPGQLKAAAGKVRCGSCNHVFNALTHLADKVPSHNDSTEDRASDIEMPASENKKSADDELDEISLPVNANVSDNEHLFKEATSGVNDEKVNSVERTNDEKLESSGEKNTSTSKSDYPDISGMTGMLSVLEDKQPEEKSQQTSRISAESLFEAPEVVSFADVDVPGVEPIKDTRSPAEIAAEKNQNDINQDIDNALDNLFDDDELFEKSENLVENDESISGVDALSELGVDSAPVKYPEKPVSSLLSELDLDGELDLGSYSNDRPPEKKPAKFDVEDSFLSSDPLKAGDTEWEPLQEETEWEPLKSRNDGQESFAGDNFKLEELEEKHVDESGGMSKVVWVSVIGLLIVVLLGQFVYLKREELAKYPAVRPILVQVCGALNLVVSCQVPDPRDVEAIVIIERNVVSHPKAKNALLISSTIANEASFPQKYPELVLTFSDINQKVLARRVFLPKEYLVKSVDVNLDMQPHVPIKILLEIVDPGEDAVNFEFDFQ